MSAEPSVVRRARIHTALGDPARLAIVDALGLGDASPGEIARELGMPTNLVAHHVNVLTDAGLVVRTRSEGDRRRTYLRLQPDALAALTPPRLPDAGRVVFVCTHNSARSQLAAALWARRTRTPAASAGTNPAARVHPRAITVARRHGLSLHPTGTAHITDVIRDGDLVIAVCDNAHEDLTATTTVPRVRPRLHWSVHDPALVGTAAAFEAAYADLAARIDRVAPVLIPQEPTMAETSTYGQYLPIDQQLALRTAAVRLAEEFAGIYGPETIERFLTTSYDQFAARSTIPHFLPLLAERFARQRLQALARVEGHHQDGKPVVMFLCTHNAGRSQMALGFFQHLAGDQAIAWSGGSEPGTEINPAAVAAMAERGIDITGEYPKPWTDEVVRAANVVITMGCGDACPIFPGTRYENWDLDDPAGLSLDAVRPIRDELERRVRHLLDQLHLTAS